MWAAACRLRGLNVAPLPPLLRRRAAVASSCGVPDLPDAAAPGAAPRPPQRPRLPALPAGCIAPIATPWLAAAPQVSDAVLISAFQKFPSFQKAKVVRYSHNGAPALRAPCPPPPPGRAPQQPATPGAPCALHLPVFASRSLAAGLPRVERLLGACMLASCQAMRAPCVLAAP